MAIDVQLSPACHRSSRIYLRHQAHPQRLAYPGDGFKAGLRVRLQRFVQSFPCHAAGAGYFSHAPRTRHIAQSSSQKARVVLFQNRRQILGHRLITVQVLRCVKAGQVIDLDLDLFFESCSITPIVGPEFAHFHHTRADRLHIAQQPK